ncbi:hypothetical protein, partial [Aquicoccus sp.]|uniref:hypothetical protein n=1 Tax=Aquicoccus sp. TaxID=2055851 RepID=UPI0035647287
PRAIPHLARIGPEPARKTLRQIPDNQSPFGASTRGVFMKHANIKGGILAVRAQAPGDVKSALEELNAD